MHSTASVRSVTRLKVSEMRESDDKRHGRQHSRRQTRRNNMGFQTESINNQNQSCQSTPVRRNVRNRELTNTRRQEKRALLKQKSKKFPERPPGWSLVVPGDPDRDRQAPEEMTHGPNKAILPPTAATHSTSREDKSAETEGKRKKPNSPDANLEFWACGSAGSKARDC